jgi:hypothetical protein
MPQDKDFKRIVRTRMATTGERYTSAKAALRPPPLPPDDPRTDVRSWLSRLGSIDDAVAAYAELEALPDDSRRQVALAGVDHENWRVRRKCCRLLDDLVLTAESVAALTTRLDDEHPEVRQAALHSLTCEGCKPDACSVDIRPLFERMLRDSSRRVRDGVVSTLGWRFHDEWSVELLEYVTANDPSPRLRSTAREGLERITAERRADTLRRRLPVDLVAKTERHPGKWVAVADGGIVDVGPGRGALQRRLHRMGREADLYWVPPN